MPTKLVIDADPGIGDAFAIAIALLDPEVDVVALTATAGQVSGAQASHNIHAILALLDPDRRPRIGDCERPVPALPEDGREFSPLLLNGPGGLGDCSPPVATLHHRHEAVKLMAELVRSEPNEITLLTLGPLTNVELAVDMHAEF